ncbi:hypothetical protein ACIQ2D_17240 [Lysinibacillus sp. NPDC097287]|uniref:hypothetical protein n=1 Tax=Lysinibacillus sp. NPDC097287 TaxID=3364144 RepID=UPI0038047A80
MQDQDLIFLLENVASAKTMAKHLHVSEKIIEELCEEGNLKAKRLNNEWAILKNQELPCLNFLQFEKSVKNLSPVLQEFNNSNESLQISFNFDTFELFIDKFDNRIPSNFTEILYKNEGVKNVLNQTILLIRCYELYLAEKTDWDLIIELIQYTSRKKVITTKFEYNYYDYDPDYDFVDLEGIEYWPYKLTKDPYYLTIQGVWIDKVIFNVDCDLISKYVVVFETNFNVTPWAKPLDKILNEVNNGASELDAFGFVAIFDSKEEAWDYARKLYPKIDLKQAITEKYYSKFPEAKEIIK